MNINNLQLNDANNRIYTMYTKQKSEMGKEEEEKDRERNRYVLERRVKAERSIVIIYIPGNWHTSLICLE